MAPAAALGRARLRLLLEAARRGARAAAEAARGGGRRGAADEARASGTAEETSRRAVNWPTRINLENTYLSYTRNAMIATVAGCAMIQFKVSAQHYDRMPVSGIGFLLLGFMYTAMGSFNYMYSYWVMRRICDLKMLDWTWICFTAAWPAMIWTSSIACFVNGAPASVKRLIQEMQSHPKLPLALREQSPWVEVEFETSFDRPGLLADVSELFRKHRFEVKSTEIHPQSDGGTRSTFYVVDAVTGRVPTASHMALLHADLNILKALPPAAFGLAMVGVGSDGAPVGKDATS